MPLFAAPAAKAGVATAGDAARKQDGESHSWHHTFMEERTHININMLSG